MGGGWELEWVRGATALAGGEGIVSSLLRVVALTLSWRYLLYFPLGALLILALVRRSSPWVAPALGCGLAILIVDPGFHQVLKPLIGRIRPCHVDPLLKTLEHCGSGFSMPSNHAGNGAALAAVVLLLVRIRWPLGLAVGGIGLAIGGSRVFMGVHYPSDVAVGWILGMGAGLLAGFLAGLGARKMQVRGWLKPGETHRLRDWVL
jgi:undecaprenyl-diphosphatase